MTEWPGLCTMRGLAAKQSQTPLVGMFLLYGTTNNPPPPPPSFSSHFHKPNDP